MAGLVANVTGKDMALAILLAAKNGAKRSAGVWLKYPGVGGEEQLKVSQTMRKIVDAIERMEREEELG